jgi:hypothetical protein
MKRSRPAHWYEITIDTPSGPYRGRWCVEGRRATGRITVSSADGTRTTQVGGHLGYEQVLAERLLREIARAAARTP